MKLFLPLYRYAGQGVTEYIIVVVLIAIGTLGVYQAWGGTLVSPAYAASGTASAAACSPARNTVVAQGPAASRAGNYRKPLKNFQN